MEKDKKYCENLYRKYEELKSKIDFSASKKKHSRKININNTKVKDMNKLIQIEKKLKNNCKNWMADKNNVF